MKFIIKLFSTGFFSGYIPIASGTFATLLSCGLWMGLSRTRGYFFFPVFFILLGIPVAGYAEKHIFCEKDSSKIVIDEIAGLLTTFLSFRFTFTGEGFIYLTVGFIFFRFFDILKPPPIRNLQEINGGLGIMLDDLASGILANIVMQLVRILFF